MLSLTPNTFRSIIAPVGFFHKVFREKRDEFSVDLPKLHHLVIPFILSAYLGRSDQFHYDQHHETEQLGSGILELVKFLRPMLIGIWREWGVGCPNVIYSWDDSSVLGLRHTGPNPILVHIPFLHSR